MIVLIAPETDIPNELEILNQLFQEGLQYYHFRKPEKSYKEHCEYLNQINPKFHNRIIVHYHHELINEYNLKGIHFQEAKRKELFNSESKSNSSELMTEYLKKLKTQNSELKTLSSSFHTPEELANCDFKFDYHLLSPVFSSISKQGYEGKGFDVNPINKKIIGMGGVTTDNLNEFTKLGFQGVGVLGGIWKSKSPISDFKIMRNYFTKQKSYI